MVHLRYLLFAIVLLGHLLPKMLYAQNLPTDSAHVLHVSVLLPFYTNRYNPDSEPVTNSTFPVESRLAIEYYYGMKCAIDSLKHIGNDIIFQTFDTNEDTLCIRKILKSARFSESDFIMVATRAEGPMYAVLDMVENYGRRTGTPVFEIASSSNFAPKLPDSIFYKLNTPPLYQAKYLLDSVISKRKPTKVWIIKTLGNDSVKFNTYLSACQKLNLDFDTVTYIKDSMSGALASRMSLIDTNIIILPSTNEDIVKSFFLDVSAIPHSFRYKFIGMPEWRFFKYSLQGFMLPNNVYIAGSEWHRKSLAQYKRLENSYANATNRSITPYITQGYEQTVWLCNAFLNGNDFKNALLNKTNTALAGRYKINKVLDKNNQWLYNMNQNIFVLIPYSTGFKKIK